LFQSTTAEERKLQFGALFVGSNGKDDGCRVQLKGDWSDSFLEKLPSQSPIDLVLMEHNGWSPGKDYSYLELIPNLRSLEIGADSHVGILPPIPSLQFLQISCQTHAPIKFDNFPILNECRLSWSPEANDIFSCTQLRKLWISKFPFKDLKNLAPLKNLEKLAIINCRLSSLSGIESGTCQQL
jgi:hypothetical protein